MDAGGLAELRAELLAGLSGEVVEVGAGNGLNFPHYPTTVTSVVAVEPQAYLRGFAERAAEQAPVPIRVEPGAAEQLPLADGSVDAAVLCQVMCSLNDRPAALAELCRVLRPGGTIRFLEHTMADTPGLLRVQRLFDATLWPLLMGGCHTATDTVGLITAAGFAISEVRRLRFPDERFTLPTTPHVIGTALAPA
jgi:ubiquinone/menaquinone biosynthesis C-methylase UbiE